MKLLVIFALCSLSATGASAQQPKRKASPSVTDLQTQIIELQRELADCKTANNELGKIKADASTRATLDLKMQQMAPILEAVAALRAVHSVADGGSIMDFKQYYLQAKVKVDSLSSSPAAVLLAPVLDAYSDANTILLAGIRSGVGTFDPGVWDSLRSKYPGVSLGHSEVRMSSATIVQGLREGGINLINEGYRRLQAAEAQLTKPEPQP